MADAAIEVRGLTRRFGERTVVDNVSFDVAAGTITGLIGPNGAGKTTLVHLLSTLLVPHGGSATVAGHDLRREPALVRGSIALTGQFAAVDDVLTGRQNLLLFGRLLGLRRRAAVARAAQLLDDFALVDVADRSVGGYSGGLRRRLDLACGLVVPRPVLFLDEPTTGLDPRSRQDLFGLVDRLRSGGTTVLLTTQYLEEADQLADRIVLIDRGRVVADGTPSELKDRIGGAVCAVLMNDDARRLLAAQVLSELKTRIEGTEVVVADATAATAAAVAGRLAGAGLEPDGLALRRASLDEVFLALTHDAPGPTAMDGAGPASSAGITG